MTLTALLLAVAGLAACAETQAPLVAAPDRADREVVVLRDVDDRRVGKVRLLEVDAGVRVRAHVRTLSLGFHGFHVHETGLCNPDAAAGPFDSAGGHYAGQGGSHGDHDGDMPSLLSNRGKDARLRFVTDAFTLDELRRGDGSAVMVHVDRDNFANIPNRYRSSLSGKRGPDKETRDTGDAGDRAACGVVGSVK